MPHVEGNLQMSNYKPVILTIKQMTYFIWEMIIKTETALYVRTTWPTEG